MTCSFSVFCLSLKIQMFKKGHVQRVFGSAIYVFHSLQKERHDACYLVEPGGCQARIGVISQTADLQMVC
jgi:hypothetical protein